MAFQIKVNSKILDYRLEGKLDLNQVKTFFEKKFTVKKLMFGGRHVLGILEKDHKELFLKLATTEGISAVTQNEYHWNEQFNKLVPRSELIQTLEIVNLSDHDNQDYQNVFLEKTNSWYNDLPKDIVKKYKVFELLEIAENSLSMPLMKPRHGDFTPWHLIRLEGGELGLIDGEHARDNGVEYYDIGYFIQRVFSVLQNPDLAQKIFSMLIENNYQIEKLNVILAARGIGGFLDESLNSSPNYAFSSKFKDWVVNLN